MTITIAGNNFTIVVACFIGNNIAFAVTSPNENHRHSSLTRGDDFYLSSIK